MSNWVLNVRPGPWFAGGTGRRRERTDYAYQGDRATTMTGALTATIAYDHAGRATSRMSVSRR
jgi:hypothetical protein